MWLRIFGMGVGLCCSMLAHADDAMLQLAQENACMTCHAIDHTVIGPSFKAVAARYRKTPNAADYLTQRLQHGSVGDWGQVPMPPNVQASPEDLRRLAQWVLTY